MEAHRRQAYIDEYMVGGRESRDPVVEGRSLIIFEPQLGSNIVSDFLFDTAHTQRLISALIKLPFSIVIAILEPTTEILLERRSGRSRAYLSLSPLLTLS